ncbi:hypothetical protein AtubIFM55763_010977 [Aspergillus tubingensis]|nr:hypothetical protein AtubIFM55763_010977 [Aspergillus tubingensis]
MRFVTLIFAALAAGPLAALAAPAPADNAASEKSCPSGDKINCGCTAQSGGGDGKDCWDNNYGGTRHVVCPGKA